MIGKALPVVILLWGCGPKPHDHPVTRSRDEATGTSTGGSQMSSNDAGRDSEIEDDLRVLGDAPSPRQDEAMHRIARRGRAAVPALLAELAADRLGGIGRARVLRLLARTAAPEALPPILAALGDHRHDARAAAIDAVAVFPDPSALAALIKLLDDPDVDVVKHVAARLGDRRDAAAIEPLSQLLERMDQGTRYSAARALASIGGPRARELLAAHLPSETDDEVRAVIEDARRDGR